MLEDDETGWLSLAGRVRWDLMMAGIQVLPNLPPGFAAPQAAGASVTEVHDRVRVTWNAPIALGDPGEKYGSDVDAVDQTRRIEVNRVMLTAMAEVLSEYTVEIDTDRWTRLDILAGPK